MFEHLIADDKIKIIRRKSTVTVDNLLDPGIQQALFFNINMGSAIFVKNVSSVYINVFG